MIQTFFPQNPENNNQSPVPIGKMNDLDRADFDFSFNIFHKKWKIN
jgi:hypothetical protein